MREQGPPRRRETDPAGRALEQGDAELPLELLDMVGDARLGERQFPGSRRERAKGGHLAKDPEPINVEYASEATTAQSGHQGQSARFKSAAYTPW